MKGHDYCLVEDIATHIIHKILLKKSEKFSANKKDVANINFYDCMFFIISCTRFRVNPHSIVV